MMDRTFQGCQGRVAIPSMQPNEWSRAANGLVGAARITLEQLK